MGFYAYLWLREDGTPYYAGKGHGRRAFHSSGHGVHRPKDRTRILVFPRAFEAEAFATEKELIANWGRKGTGCLRNITDGGEGTSGLPAWNKDVPMSAAAKQKLSRSKQGQRHPQSAETRAKIGDFNRDKIVSEETCRKISLSKQGKPSTWKGKTASPETREKQRRAKLGRPWTAAQREGRMRAAEEKKKCRISAPQVA